MLIPSKVIFLLQLILIQFQSIHLCHYCLLIKLYYDYFNYILLLLKRWLSENSFLQSAYKVLSKSLFLGPNDSLNLKNKTEYSIHLISCCCTGDTKLQTSKQRTVSQLRTTTSLPSIISAPSRPKLITLH